jgi:MFS family permease
VVLASVGFGAIDVLAPLRLGQLGMASTAVGATFLVAAAVNVVISPLAGRSADRRGPLPPVRLGLAAAAPLTLVLAGPDQALVLAVVVVAADAALAVVCAPAITLLSAASEGAGLGQGAAFALVNLAWAGGQVVGAASAGGLAAATADVVPYALLASLCLVTLTGTLVRVRATTQV